MSSPSLTHDKGLPKHLEELDKSHLEGDLRHKQPGNAPPHPGTSLATALRDRGGRCPITRAGKPRPPAAEELAQPHAQRAESGCGDRAPSQAHASGPPTPPLTPSLTSSAPPAGPGKLSGEAAHLPHLRPLPESQPSSSPLLQTTPGVKGHQRVVTLAQHISVTTPSLPPALGGDEVPGEGDGHTQPLGLMGKPSPGGPDQGGRAGTGRLVRDSRLSDSDAEAAPSPSWGASGA